MYGVRTEQKFHFQWFDRYLLPIMSRSCDSVEVKWKISTKRPKSRKKSFHGLLMKNPKKKVLLLANSKLVRRDVCGKLYLRSEYRFIYALDGMAV